MAGQGTGIQSSSRLIPWQGGWPGPEEPGLGVLAPQGGCMFPGAFRFRAGLRSESSPGECAVSLMSLRGCFVPMEVMRWQPLGSEVVPEVPVRVNPWQGGITHRVPQVPQEKVRESRILLSMPGCCRYCERAPGSLWSCPREGSGEGRSSPKAARMVTATMRRMEKT